jgi:hypothetical protein
MTRTGRTRSKGYKGEARDKSKKSHGNTNKAKGDTVKGTKEAFLVHRHFHSKIGLIFSFFRSFPTDCGFNEFGQKPVLEGPMELGTYDLWGRMKPNEAVGAGLYFLPEPITY